jgi:hypothetical protein
MNAWHNDTYAHPAYVTQLFSGRLALCSQVCLARSSTAHLVMQSAQNTLAMAAGFEDFQTMQQDPDLVGDHGCMQAAAAWTPCGGCLYL